MAGERQGGQVFKTPSGKWAIRFYEADGTRRQIGGFDLEKHARAELAKQLRRARRGVHAGDMTVTELLDEFEEQHAQNVEPETMVTLRYQLRHARREFGKLRLDRVTARSIALWRSRMTPGIAHEAHRAFKQALAYAVRTRLLEENPAADVPNPRQRPPEIQPFESHEEIDLLAGECGDRWGPVVVFACETGLRPQELWALERGDINRQDAVVEVNRVYTRNLRVKAYGKTPGSTRRVPLSDRALEALDAFPTSLQTRILFPREDGGHVNHVAWRRDVWTPSVEEWIAGDPEGRTMRRPYDCRHTYAAFQIRAGVPVFYLARFMGTSVVQIDRTYGHLVPDSEEFVRDLQNAYARAGRERREARRIPHPGG